MGRKSSCFAFCGVEPRYVVTVKNPATRTTSAYYACKEHADNITQQARANGRRVQIRRLRALVH